VADQFQEVIERRVAELEARVTAEAESVKEHFAELQSFITFSLTRQTAELRAEFKRDIQRVEQRLDGVEQRLGNLEQRFDALELRFDRLEQRFDGLEHRFDALDRKVDVHFEAIRLILGDILDRLPARNG